MRMRFVTRQLAAAVMSGIALGGCSYLELFENPQGVSAPKPTTIGEYISEVQIDAVANSLGRRVTAGEYLVASLSYTNEQCHQFFDTLERFKDDNSTFGKVLDAAAAAGVPLIGFKEASRVAVRFASAVALGKQVNTSLGEIYGYVAHRDQLMRHVLEQMADFRRKNGISALTRGLVGVNDFTTVADDKKKMNPITYGESYSTVCSRNDSLAIAVEDTSKTPHQVNSCKLDSFLSSTEPVNLLVARNIAGEYASLCSLSNLKAIIGGALGATKSKVAAPDSAATDQVAKEVPKAGTQ